MSGSGPQRRLPQLIGTLHPPQHRLDSTAEHHPVGMPAPDHVQDVVLGPHRQIVLARSSAQGTLPTRRPDPYRFLVTHPPPQPASYRARARCRLACISVAERSASVCRPAAARCSSVTPDYRRRSPRPAPHTSRSPSGPRRPPPKHVGCDCCKFHENVGPRQVYRPTCCQFTSSWRRETTGLRWPDGHT